MPKRVHFSVRWNLGQKDTGCPKKRSPILPPPREWLCASGDCDGEAGKAGQCGGEEDRERDPLRHNRGVRSAHKETTTLRLWEGLVAQQRPKV